MALMGKVHVVNMSAKKRACACGSGEACLVPPRPDLVQRLFQDYARRGRPLGLSFSQFQQVTGFVHRVVRENNKEAVGEGSRCPSMLLQSPPSPKGQQCPELLGLPRRVVQSKVAMKILLVDFPDQMSKTSNSYFVDAFFSEGVQPGGSIAEYFKIASVGKVEITGQVHGWLRMPQNYSYYTNGESGLGRYPHNSQRMVEDAIRVAQSLRIPFEKELDADNDKRIDALVVVHAGSGAEGIADPKSRGENIWSHKWVLHKQLNVGGGLNAFEYCTLNEMCELGIAAHELGHLLFGWDDFYDPNCFDDGKSWDGSGEWDLMACGAWNGSFGDTPSLPACWHRIQQNWLEVVEVRSTVRNIELPPQTASFGKAVKILSPVYRDTQFLLLEARNKTVGTPYDKALPGDGLLVWRVDLQNGQQQSSELPVLSLVEADGKGDLLDVDSQNQVESSDSFPGASNRTYLDDVGIISTSFPSAPPSGFELRNIAQNPKTGVITLDIVYDGSKPLASKLQPAQKKPEKVCPKNMELLSEIYAEIPASDPTGMLTKMKLKTVGFVTELEVEADISHPHPRDLRIEIVSPDGISAVVFNRSVDSDHLLQAPKYPEVIAGAFKVQANSKSMSTMKPLIGVQSRGQWALRAINLSPNQGAILQSWRLMVTAAPQSKVVQQSASPRQWIKDANGVGSTIEVKEIGCVKSVKVKLTISHKAASQIHASLVAPSGELAHLCPNGMTGGKKGTVTVSLDSVHSVELFPLVGSNANGKWLVIVTDEVGKGTSCLDSWSLQLETVPPTISH